MTETAPDTIYVPTKIYVQGPERIVYSTEVQRVAPEVVPIETVPEPQRDSVLMAAVIDWNTTRAYKGTLFDDPAVGTVSYDFAVQFNRVGQIGYQFVPARTAKPPPRLRPTVGGEYYTNGMYAFGVGAQRGAIGVNVRALKIDNSYALGIGVQVIF
jgi:hypothetical protein